MNLQSFSQVVILAAISGVSAFAAAPTILSGDALTNKRGGVACTVGPNRLDVDCDITPGYMFCAFDVQRCNFDAGVKTRLCNPKGSADSICSDHVECKSDNDDTLLTPCEPGM
ncbi:MAG: hypothetical protein ACKVP0_00025 [Pirellulaceae bacterium]